MGLHLPLAAQMPELRFHSAVSASCLNDVSFRLRHRLCPDKDLLHLLPLRHRFDLRRDSAAQLLKGLLHILFSDPDCAVSLQPFPCCVGRHRETSVLCLPKPRLYLNVSSRTLGQELLPVISAPGLSPGKELSGAQPVRGHLEQAAAVASHMCDILRLVRRNVKKVVHRGRDILIPRDIIAIDDRN